MFKRQYVKILNLNYLNNFYEYILFFYLTIKELLSLLDKTSSALWYLSNRFYFRGLEAGFIANIQFLCKFRCVKFLLYRLEAPR